MADINLLYGSVSNFDNMPVGDFVEGRLFFANDNTNTKSYLYFDNGSAYLNIIPRLLGVVNGGTGKTSLDSGKALIGNGTNAVNLRSITDKTATSTLSSTSNNLITERAVYYYKGSDSIETVGIISSGTWNGDVITVPHGGTGAATFTAKGVLYGNGNLAIQSTAAGAKGQLLSPNASGVPGFASPTISWDGTTDSSVGPKFKFTIQGQEWSSNMPAASASSSGAVTTGTQTFAGDKTFTGLTQTASVRPTTNLGYDLGDQTHGWANIYSKFYKVVNTVSSTVGNFYSSTTGTTSAVGSAYLDIGNSSASGTSGNAKGYLRLYGQDSGSVALSAKNLATGETASNLTIEIPRVGGNVTISGTTAYEGSSTASTHTIPFYTKAYEKVQASEAYKIYIFNGTTSTAGESRLILGNTTATGKAGNKMGKVQLYGSDDEYVVLSTNPASAAESTDVTAYSVYLPFPSEGIGELTYHPTGSGVGGTSRPVYVESNGKISAVSSVGAAYGGTGRTTLTSGSILYGNGTGTVNLLAKGTNGQMVISNGTNPIYASPSMQWTESSTPSTTGPRFDFKFNNQVFAGDNIPAASDTTSGIVTTGEQNLAGEKAFLNNVYTANVIPMEASAYECGEWGRPWWAVHTNHIRTVSQNRPSTWGIWNNEITYGDFVGHQLCIGCYDDYSWGVIYIGAGDGNHSTTFISSAAQGGNERSFWLPDYSGYAAVFRNTTGVSNTTELTYTIPVKTGNTQWSWHLEDITGFQLLDLRGTSTSVGKSYLILGNNSSGTTAGNKEGRIRLYGNDTYYSELRTNDTNGGNYTISLPAASGELVYHTENASQGGSCKLLQVSAAGQISNDTTSDAGTDTLPVYLVDGTITSCIADKVFSDFSSSPGVNGETLSITVAGKARTVTLDAASTSQGGVITTGAQSLAGAKTFTGAMSITNTTTSSSYSTGALKVSGGVGIAGAVYTNSTLNVASNGTFGGDLIVNGGDFELGTSTERCKFTYDASTDTLTLSFP